MRGARPIGRPQPCSEPSNAYLKLLAYRSVPGMLSPMAIGDRLGARVRKAGPQTGLCEALVGGMIPSGLHLTAASGPPVEPRRDTAPAVVVYFYPGTSSYPDGGSNSENADAAQQRAFDRHRDDFSALALRPIGVSSASVRALRTSVFENRIGYHDIWSDPQLLLGQALGLPTFEHAGTPGYRRLTMVVRGGQVAKVFFPVDSPERSASQVICWLRATG
jgi:peroxiredoxin